MNLSEILAKLQKLLEKKEQWYYDNTKEYGNAVRKGEDKKYLLAFIKSMTHLNDLINAGFVIDYEGIAKEFDNQCIPFIIEEAEAEEKWDVRERVIGQLNAWRKAFNCRIHLGDDWIDTNENKFLIYLQKLNHSFSGKQISDIGFLLTKRLIDVSDESSWIYDPALFPADGSADLFPGIEIPKS